MTHLNHLGPHLENIFFFWLNFVAECLEDFSFTQFIKFEKYWVYEFMIFRSSGGSFDDINVKTI